ncbi:MAG: sulfurtransferase [Desulfobulbaceae bacterium A2]|nr:MAG: sulfurtransferase [Desulfobulbaceae bacterium A2]
MKRLLGVGLAVLLTLAVSSSGWCKDKFEQEVETETAAVKLLRDTERGGYKIVNTAELKQWIDSGKPMVIVDTMPFADSYRKEHVPGAKQFLFPIPDMPEWNNAETDGKSQADFEAVLGPDKDKIVVMYCGFVKCTRSHNGAVWASKLGYKNVYRYPGGVFAWKGAKYPVEKAQ